MKLYDRTPPDPNPGRRRGPTGCPRDLLRRLAPLARAKDGSWAALTGCSAASTRASAARRGDLRRSSRRTWCSSAMTTLTVLLPHAQGLGAAFLGRRAGLPPRAEAARSQALCLCLMVCGRGRRTHRWPPSASLAAPDSAAHARARFVHALCTHPPRLWPVGTPSGRVAARRRGALPARLHGISRSNSKSAGVCFVVPECILKRRDRIGKI